MNPEGRYVPAGEIRPLLAIETTEDWVRGLSTTGQVREAANASRSYGETIRDLSRDLAAAAYTPDLVEAAAYAASYAAYAAAITTTFRWAHTNASWAATRVMWAMDNVADFEGKRRLVDVIAEAIMTFPRRRANT